MAQGKANQVFPALQADDCFVVTPGANDIVDDVNNVSKYGQVVLKNNTASDVTATVIPAHSATATTIDILIKSGTVEPLAVRRVTAATGQVLGYVGHQGMR
jgi:hypothetical protein